MKDDIKEIDRIIINVKRKLQFSPERRFVELFNKDEINKLLDYITNLQEENKRIKNLEYKFFDNSGDEESFTLEDYLELGNKLYDLQEENERLKNEKPEYILRWKLEEQLEDYKSRNEKAIKYIEQEAVFYDSYDGEDTMLEELCERYYKELLNILNGGDEE